MVGDLTVISGPTAVGKGTVVAAIKERHPEVWISISATTRAPRPGEIDGVQYYFISSSEFDDLITTDGLLEWAEVHGATKYGTLRKPVEEAMSQGRHVILEIDVQGARQVRQHAPRSRFIFIAPPSFDTLRARLLGRGTETSSEMERRLRTAEAELACQDEFDHVVVNDDLNQAVSDLVDLLGL